MCTALHIQTSESGYFGRNMDIPFFFHQQPLEIPKGFRYWDRAGRQQKEVKRCILGMGSVIDGYPAMAEAMNEDGLACAGLNFAGFARYEQEPEEGRENVAPYDLILWALSNYGSLTELRPALEKLRLVAVPINESTPLPTLHWMFADRSGKSLVVEATQSGLQVYENPVGVMSNNPEFPWHRNNLREYLHLRAQDPSPARWSDLTLEPLGVGTGSLGLPGDFGSASRFVRTAFLRASLPEDLQDEQALAQFFHVLDAAAMVRGGVITSEGLYDYTVYSSCMDLRRCIYYYKTFENNRICGISMKKGAGKELLRYPYRTAQDICWLA